MSEMFSSINLDDNLSLIKGVGPSLSNNFKTLNINTVRDLIYYAPRRYDDYSELLKVKQFKPGLISAKLTINNVSGRYVRRGLHITEALGSDETGSVRLVWFNQPYRVKNIKNGVVYYVSGKFGLSSGRMLIVSPAIEIESDFPINTNGILPVYKTNKNLTITQIRRSIRAIYSRNFKIKDYMPPIVIKQEGLISLAAALKNLHFPKSQEDLSLARLRLSFDEIFALSLVSFKNREILKNEHANVVEIDVDLAKKFIKKLPFNLTDSQRAVIWRIYLDLAKDRPMNRLLEGDVGSGKTVVALMSALMVMNKGWQVAFLAPTEVLAKQHANTIFKLLKGLGLEKKVGLLVGSMSLNQKKIVKEKLAKNEILLIVGTHALLESDVSLKQLALLIVDEQHRFGVNQRKILQLNADTIPHLLTLSATPIPRSLALTLFGELSISRLTEKPHQSTNIKTEIIAESNINHAYSVIEQEIKQGHQVFVVCPLIIKSETKSRRKDVHSVYQELGEVFPKFRLGLLHGKLSADEKDRVLSDFVTKKLDLVVSTTVIEVGVDVPNATVMVIFDAESFGLAQIHQLRGRVGRGKHSGFCFLIGDEDILKNERMNSLVRLSSGFELAEVDLKLRGPGAFYGLSQHGLTDLKFTEFSNLEFIKKVKTVALRFFTDNRISDFKDLDDKVSELASIRTLD